MALHFYGGAVTIGGTNGTLLSSGDGSAPLVFDGMFPGASDVTKKLTIAVRADPGEQWYHCVISLKGTYQNRFYLSNYAYTSTNMSFGNSLYYPIVGDTNKLLDITAYAGPTDPTGPDTSVDLVIVHAIRIV